ncbi:uncharacterized protein L201_000607 [Kwoniella dendrophila CBS 6074]|uniref:Rab-GAP TBC domain-containing protein n=1 Tax=Kwoniella dendrophila CBS 6074 TaxID=1295534 RepID=A0AAX4JK05_9TREE
MDTTIRQEVVFPRPSVHEVRSTWKELLSDPLISPSRLRATALSKTGLGSAASDGGVILRSVYWRFYHGLLPTPTSPALFPASLATSREAYNSLRRRYLIAPDGRWASDCTGSEDHRTSTNQSFASSSSSVSAAGASTSNGDGWDPLSLDSSSPWKTWFKHVELRATILQDVERTFPDIPYFQLPRVRKCLTTSLFLYSVLNPDVGYRQGMHELLACSFLAVDRDSLDNTTKDQSQYDRDHEEAMWSTLDRTYVEHDAFQLFQSIMKGAKEFYEWRAEEGPIKNRSANAPQAPIITRCNHIHTDLLRRIDPQLWERLETEGVEAQIWAIRWIRLIFTREIPFPIAMRIWDGVFAEDPGLGLLDFVCVAMLLLIRNELIEADYPTLLTQLLHYPSPSPTYPFEPFMILSQAIFLKDNISPAAGVEVVLQNQDVLGVKVNPPERSNEERSQTQSSSRGGYAQRGLGRGSRGRAGMSGLAQGLFEKAQAAGLDKAFMTTVADLRKNLPDSATAYSYLPNLPFSPAGAPSREIGSFSTIPSSTLALPRSFLTSPSSTQPVVAQRPFADSRPSVDSVATEQSLKDAELEMAELRLAMVGMGKAMSEWLSLLQPTAGLKLEEQQNANHGAEIENAWRGLEMIKDGLLDAAGKETEQIVREWGWHEGLETSSSRASTPAPVDSPGPSSQNFPSNPSNPYDHQAPPGVLMPEPSVGRGTLEFEDTTPTLPQLSTMPPPPSFPAPPKISSPVPSNSKNSTFSNNNSSIKPSSLTISSRSTPSSGLPRTPIPNLATLPLRPQSAAGPVNGTRDKILDRSLDESGKSQTRESNIASDPLAGLGVTTRDKNDGWRKGKGLEGNSGVDPLLGVGVR